MISIILPVFKNSCFLEELINRIHRSLDASGYKHEIICVNDCCPESSMIILEQILRSDHRLRVINLKRNVGQHKAVLTGMIYAQGDWIAVMDADLQDPPEFLPQILAIAKKNNAVVFAGRRGRYESSNRLLTSRIFKQCFALIARVPRDAGMFFAIPQGAKESMFKMKIREPFVIAMLGAVPFKKISYPVQRQMRMGGVSGYSSIQRIISGMRAVKCALQCRFGLFSAGSPDYTSYVQEDKDMR